MVNNVLHFFVSVELIRTNRSNSSDTLVSPALSHNPFRIRTYEKRARNSFRIRTSKTQDLKSFRIRTYKKRRGEGCKLLTRISSTAVLYRTAKSSEHRPLCSQGKQECLCYSPSSAKSLARGVV